MNSTGNDGTGTVTVPRRFRGPSQSANGGYMTGLLVEMVGGTGEITLKAPPPLDTPMSLVTVAGDGDSTGGLDLLHGDSLVAMVRHSPAPDLELPACPTAAEATAASAAYPGHHDSPVPHCFVCGRERLEGDALRVFTGPLPDTGDGASARPAGMVAAPWVPHANFVDPETGFVADRYVLAALDCPGAWAFYGESEANMLLGRMRCTVLGRVRPGDSCTVAAWQLGAEGRKAFAGSAVYGADGAPVACGYATWIRIPKLV